jgi:hypothetical protein
VNHRSPLSTMRKKACRSQPQTPTTEQQFLQFPTHSTSKLLGRLPAPKAYSPVSPLTAQSNAVLGAMPVLSRIHSDSNTDHVTTAAPTSPPEPKLHASESSNSYESDSPPEQSQVDWSTLCRCLTGEDLDACEVDTKQHLLEYYGPQHVAPSSTLIDSLDDSIRDMESRKAITMRIRKVGWAIALAFFLAFVGSIGLLLGSDVKYLPVQGLCYLAACLTFALGYPMIGRQTVWFRTRPLLPLHTLHQALDVWAAITCAVLFIGSLELHGSEPLASQPSPSTSEGWSRWILCSLPLFVGYLLHDLHSRAAVMWCVITAVTITSSHVINELWIGSVRASYPSVRGIQRSQQWYLELGVQLLFLFLNLFFARAASLSIQSHVVQLWHREKFMLEQGKYLAAQREAAFSTANQKSTFLANMSHEIRTPSVAGTGMA